MTSDELDKDTEQPFQIVLVDIEKAAKDNVIFCVEKSLEESDLNFVTLSYRWGELQETLIDTGVGYAASITSFHLNDFYQLCHMMTLESELKSIKYVWVDAICVDQQHHDRRKQTIHRMSDIYEKATYVLAVPDLHLAHLKTTSMKHRDIMEGSALYALDLYHLIHGNADRLRHIEATFLDNIGVPTDPALRHLLTHYTDCFADGLMTYRRHGYPYCPTQTLDHICQIQPERGQLPSCFKDLHEGEHCPLKKVGAPDNQDDTLLHNDYKSLIMERSTAIRHSMALLADLVRDWSSRVWVISEYSLAKKKNNLKYWFVQLQANERFSNQFKQMDDFRFFKFDFEHHPTIQQQHPNVDDIMSWYATNDSSNPVYIYFHQTMTKQLNQQTFLEMMLKSKASKNEDRFYSILPLSEYKSNMRENMDWDIHTTVAVKLKLYEIMSTKDKLILLFWSGHFGALNKGTLLPTFATSTLPLGFQNGELTHCPQAHWNFDLTNPSALLYQTKSSSSLQLKPLQYFVYDHDALDAIGLRPSIIHTTKMDLVCIPALTHDAMTSTFHQYYIILVGRFVENQWTLDQSDPGVPYTDPHWMPRDNTKSAVFNIY
ncbi:unnamed protein product [Absidia cylindrospora]